MIVPLRLNQEMFDRLADLAARERRPLAWQAEVLLCQALGLVQDASKGTTALADSRPESAE
jgi:hypothetical protein